MKKKVFSLMMTFVLAFMGLAQAQSYQVGSGTSTNSILPGNCYYRHSLTQQIYTAEELGLPGTITSIAFYNGGTADLSRAYDIYMVNTDKAAFANTSDWIVPTAADLVYSDTATFVKDEWTTLTLDTPFDYDGIHNIAIIVKSDFADYGTGSACRVFTAASQTLYAQTDGTTEFNPLVPPTSGTILSSKNQIVFGGLEGPRMSANLPTNSYYKFGVTQQLYTAAELDTTGDITKIAFKNDGETKTRNVDVYITLVGDSITTIDNWIDVDSTDLVYSGNLTFTAGAWTEIPVHRLTYDGTQNIVITFDDNSDVAQAGLDFLSMPDVVANSSMYYFSDDSTRLNPNPTDLSGITGTSDSIRSVVKFTFTPTGLVEIGSGTSTSSYLPDYYLYDYSLTQQIYTKEEIDYTGKIESIAFFRTSSGSTTRNIDVYFMEVDTNVFTSTTAWFHPTAADKVYSGDYTYVGGDWNIITLDEPYEYDCTHHLAIIVDDNSGNWVSSASYRVFSATNQSLYKYQDGTDLDPMTISVAGTRPTNKNQIQIRFQQQGPATVLPADLYFLDSINSVTPIDTLELGFRPTGAWMRPAKWTLYNKTNRPVTVRDYDFTPNPDFFYLLDPQVPFSMDVDGEENFYFVSDTTGEFDSVTEIHRQFAIMYDTRAAGVWDICVHVYEPVENDVFELATEVDIDSLPYRDSALVMDGTDQRLYDNYVLAPDTIEDGFDAVYKLTFDDDMQLFASVYGENAKIALYTEDFYFDEFGIPGPDIENTYNGPVIDGGQGGGAAYDVIVGDSASTSGYYPFYTFYNNSVSEQIFTATELNAAGVQAGVMDQIGFLTYSNWEYTQDNVKIWMANVDAEAFASPWETVQTDDMDLVYDGPFTPVIGWNMIELDGGFYWDGNSNLMIAVESHAATYHSGLNWVRTNTSFESVIYKYSDTQVYDLESETYTSCSHGMYRNVVRFASGVRDVVAGMDYYYNNPTNDTAMIFGMPVEAGTYYLVASSTDPTSFIVEIDANAIPCPDLAFGPIPADDADELQPRRVDLQWQLGENTTEYRLVFGSTYYCEETLVDWTSDLAESYTVRNLYNNTNYFWRVDERNSNCEVEGTVWGFTTHLNIPEGLAVLDESIFEGETAYLYWDNIDDRTFRQYNIYVDGVLVGSTPMTYDPTAYLTYELEDLTYNMNPGYAVQVSAVYDEGESALSEPLMVKVSGYGSFFGHVWEQDGVTGIEGAEIIIAGYNEFNETFMTSVTTSMTGAYSVVVPVSSTATPYTTISYTLMAHKDGYQGYQTPLQGYPLAVVYNQNVQADFILDEEFLPVSNVWAEYYPDITSDDEYVKVYWTAAGNMIGGELTVCDGTSTSSYIPVYGLWHDDYTRDEMIYPADMLAPLAGTQINSLKYYISSPSTGSWAPATFNVYLMEVSSTTLSSYYGSTDATVVYSGELDGTGSEMVINFTTPYHYNGGNLLVGIEQPVEGTYHSCYFYGIESTGSSASGYSSSSLAAVTFNQRNFLPKTTFNGGRGGEMAKGDRAFHHYRIYRTSCYNDGPYNSDNTVMLASDWPTDTVYIDTNFDTVSPGVYKWGVSCVYEGNRTDVYPDPYDRESDIVWSNCLDKDMYLDDVDVTVLLNSADSPEGTRVSFVNVNPIEQELYPMTAVTLGDDGYYEWSDFRRGTYEITVSKAGYETETEIRTIDGPTHLRYVLTEIIYGVENIYVSRTGWAMWDPIAPSGAGSIIDFETGDFSQYDFDNSVTSYPWTVTSETAFEGNYCMKSTNSGIASSTSAIEATVNMGSDGTVSFAALCQGEGTSTIWDKCRFLIDGAEQFSYGANMPGWNEYSFPISSGSHILRWEYSKDGSVNPTGDAMYVDNISFSTGRSEGDRHLEGYKVMCTSIDGVPIFTNNTLYPHPFCQLTTFDPNTGLPFLEEGEHYIVNVCAIYSTGQSGWASAEFEYEPCEHWGPVDEVTASTEIEGNHIEWTFDNGYNPYDPSGPTPGPGPTPGDNVTVTLTADDVWGDGSGYQMLLDDTHSLYGTVIPETGALSTSCSGNEAIYNQFSHKIPTNADGNCSTQNMVNNTSVTITIPAGTYDWCITNPTPGDRIWIASSNGTIGGRYDDFTFEAGNEYEFHVYFGGLNDAVDLNVIPGNKGIHSMGQSNDDCKTIDDVTPVAFRGEYGGGNLETGMLATGLYAFNITDIASFDERVFFISNLTKDERFEVIVDKNNSVFLINTGKYHENEDLESNVNAFVAENAAEFAAMDKETAAETCMTLKSELSADILNALMLDIYASSRENNLCALGDPFCTDNGMYEFPAGVNAGSGEAGPDYNCLYTTPNPAWYYMRIGNPGAIDIYMYSTPQVDIDFCCWGPFDDPIEPCPNGLTANKVVSCSYSAAATEHCNIPATAQTGEYYILVITNYSNQPCNINFSQVAGSGNTDCGILPPVDIIGFLITLDGEYLDIVGPTVREYTHYGEYGDHEYCVRPIYPGEMTLPSNNFGWSMGCPVCDETNGEMSCEPGMPISGVYYWESGDDFGAVISWGSETPGPGPQPGTGDEFFEDFDNGLPTGWTTIDADGDGYDWVAGSQCGGIYLAAGASLAGSGHNSSADLMTSGSYSNATYAALTPDNFLVSPLVTIGDGSTFSFWACAQDASYAAEHFGVAVSTDGVNYTMVQEWTMTAKEGGKAVRGMNAQGSWYQKTVDLSDYAGEDCYIAIRHFNCTDMFMLDIDDVELSNGAKRDRAELIAFNVYRSVDLVDWDLIGIVPAEEGTELYEYYDNVAAGDYYYAVTAVYDNGCESDFALSAINPTLDYVYVQVTGIDDLEGRVALYPNPTNGLVKIEAQGMTHISVVSILGQMVFDSDVNADQYEINMAQFNAGVYVVRIATEHGVSTQRVTVVK